MIIISLFVLAEVLKGCTPQDCQPVVCREKVLTWQPDGVVQWDAAGSLEEGEEPDGALAAAA